MAIREDAGELLLFVYKKYIEKYIDELTTFEDFKKESGWNEVRIMNAVEYLKDRELINVNSYYMYPNDGRSFVIYKIYPNGIDIIEDKQKFKDIFGFEINLGMFKFSWTRTKEN